MRTNRYRVASDARPERRASFGHALVAALLVAALAACAGDMPAAEVGPPPGVDIGPPAAEGAAPTLEGAPPSGFVDMREVQVAYIGSAGGGTGMLTFQGQVYPFDVAGLGVGGIGISTIDAQGEVYKLADIGQFAGAYAQGRYGAVLGTASAGDLWLENEQGVVMHLKAKREGLMLSVGADAVDVRMRP